MVSLSPSLNGLEAKSSHSISIESLSASISLSNFSALVIRSLAVPPRPPPLRRPLATACFSSITQQRNAAYAPHVPWRFSEFRRVALAATAQRSVRDLRLCTAIDERTV